MGMEKTFWSGWKKRHFNKGNEHENNDEIPNSAVVTAELNQVYSSIEKSHLDPIFDGLQRATLTREEW